MGIFQLTDYVGVDVCQLHPFSYGSVYPLDEALEANWLIVFCR